jgi:hypothetical protein
MLQPRLEQTIKAQLIRRRNAASMPPAAICARMNNACKVDLFDETIAALASDKRGRFAVVVNQEAAHAIVNEAPPEIAAAQSVL